MATHGLGRGGFGAGPENLIIVSLLAVIAAVLIPRFVRTRENVHQLQTEDMLTTIAGALGQYYEAHGNYPRATSIDQLSEALQTDLPGREGWFFPLKYECWSDSPDDAACTEYALGSAGTDRVWEEESLRGYEATVEPLSPDADMVFRNGAFVQKPPGWDLSWRESWLSLSIAVLAGSLLLSMLLIVYFGVGPIELARDLVGRIVARGRPPLS